MPFIYKTVKVALVEEPDDYLKESLNASDTKMNYIIGNVKKNINVSGYIKIRDDDKLIFKFDTSIDSEEKTRTVEEVASEIDVPSGEITQFITKIAEDLIKGGLFTSIALKV